MKPTGFLSLMAVLLLSAGPSFAEESRQGSHQGEHVSGSHHHRNIIAGFIGITEEDRRERALTLGLDYNRWVTPSFGIGVGVEHAFGDLDFTVLTVPFAWRTGAWKFFAGPGWEKSDHHESSGRDEHDMHGDGHSGGTEFLVRAGVEYAFEVGGWEIAPKVMVDYIDDDFVLVGGVAIGLGF